MNFTVISYRLAAVCISINLFFSLSVTNNSLLLRELFIFGAAAFLLGPIVLSITNNRMVFYKSRFWVSYFLLVSLFIVLSTVNSDAPEVITVFGWLGRADGIFLLLSVIIIFLGLSSSSSYESSTVLLGIFVGLGISSLIGLLQVLGFNPVPTAGYSGVSATFGNPNFSGAIFGLSSIALFWYSFNFKQAFIKYSLIALSAWWLVLSVLSESLQGPVTAGLTLFVTLYFKLIAFSSLKIRLRKYLVVVVPMFSIIFVCIVSVSTNFISQVLNLYTIQTRQNYWVSAVRMARDNFLFGVGPDNFQRYVGMYKPLEQIELMGPNIMVSAAHNVFLQKAATLGFPAALLLFSLLIYPLYLLFKESVFSHQNNEVGFDRLALISLLVGYLIQSLISIDAPSSKVIGWAAAGLVIASYSKDRLIVTKKRTTSQGQPRSITTVWTASTMGVIFFFIPSLINLSHTSAYELSEQKAMSMLQSRWTPCQIRFELLLKVKESRPHLLADEFVDKLVEVDDRCYEVLSTLVNWSLSQNNPTVALSLSERLVEIDPLNYRRFLALADSQRVAGQTRLAKEAFEKSKSLYLLFPDPADDTLMRAFESVFE